MLTRTNELKYMISRHQIVDWRDGHSKELHVSVLEYGDGMSVLGRRGEGLADERMCGELAVGLYIYIYSVPEHQHSAQFKINC